MKRFFHVFTIILIVFLFLAAGSIAAMTYCGINALSVQNGKQPVFLGGWGVTLMPYTGSAVVYPDGDLFVIQRASADTVKPGDVVLYANGTKWYVRSGYIASKSENGFNITASDGITAEEPAAAILGRYYKRVPYMGKVLTELESLPAIIVFAVVLALSFVLWLALPSRKDTGGALSESDKDIASILY